MSKTPFIDGDAPRPGGKESEAAKQEWEQTEKPKKMIGVVLLVLLVVGGGVGMAALMKATAPESAEGEEVQDKTKFLRLTNTTDEMAWVDCIIGDPEDGGMEYSKKLSSKEGALVEMVNLPVECKAKDADGTEYWSWRGMKYGSAEEGVVVDIKRDKPKEPPKEEAPEGDAEGAEGDGTEGAAGE